MGGWRQRAVIAALVVGLLGARASTMTAEGAAARVVDGHIADWRGISSGVGGSVQQSNGELVYQDHLFDDLGADTNLRSTQHGTAERSKGDFRYPEDPKYGHNAADLQEVRLAPDGADLWLLARLSTLKADATTVVAFAFDVDGAPEDAGVRWPFDAGIAAAGADVVVTLWGTGGEVTDLRTGETAPVTDVAVSTDDNAIEARVDRSIVRGATTITVWAASGLWDAATSTWLTPENASPAVSARAFNVAFRGWASESGPYLENEQAEALASGNITSFATTVDLDALEAGVEVPFEITGGHFYDVIFDTGFSIGPEHEGASYSGQPGRFAGVGGAALSQHFDYFGRYQPYGLYVPSTYGTESAIPAALVLHGIGGSQSTYNTRPGFINDMGEGDGGRLGPPMFLITPLARGSSFYADYGEADTIAVLDDVVSRFPIDRERLYLTGYSMGGYGVYRLASIHPDWFAAAASWAGYTGEFTGAYLTDPLAPAGVSGNRGKANIGDPVQTLENLHELPLVHLSGSNDEIVPTSGQYAAPKRLSELGYRSRWDLFPGYEHFSFALVDDWKQVRTWLGDRRRATAPRQVDYRFSDLWTDPELPIELVHDGAYWIRGLTTGHLPDGADAFTIASVSATSHAIAARSITVHRDRAPAPEPTPHLQHLVWWEEGDLQDDRNQLDLAFRYVETATIDTGTAGLRLCGLDLVLTTDGPVRVALDGHVPTTAHVVGSDGVHLNRDAHGVVLDVSEPMQDATLRILCRP